MPKYLPAGLTQYVLNYFCQEVPSVPRRSRRRFGSPPTTGGGEDHWPLVGPGTRWRHRGAIQDALGDFPNYPVSGKWTSTSPAPTFGVVVPAFRASTAKPTAFTAGCVLVRHSASSPGTMGSVFYRRATLVTHPRSRSTANTIRFSPREPTLGTIDDGLWVQLTMGCGGLRKPVRVRRRLEYTWSDFWTTRGRSSSFPRRATRPQRVPYEVLGACRSTKPACSLRGSNVM